MSIMSHRFRSLTIEHENDFELYALPFNRHPKIIPCRFLFFKSPWIPGSNEQGNCNLIARKMLDKSFDHRIIPGLAFLFPASVILDGSETNEVAKLELHREKT
jgi:hypothetical protein